MRQWKVAALGLLATAVLVSCYLMGNIGKGSITVELPKMQAKLKGEVARVYLLADGQLFSTGGNVPFSAEVVPASYPDSTRISIQGLPVGPRYQALVGVGYVSGGLLTVSYFGYSAPFALSPNADTAVEVNTQSNYLLGSITFASDLAGKNLKGVSSTSSYTCLTADDSNLYFWESSGPYLYQYDLAADPGLSSYRVNSLSGDLGQLSSLYNATFINSNLGVLPFNYSEGFSFQTDFSSMLSGPKNILKSGSFLVGANWALFFQRADGLGGSYVNQLDQSNPSIWTWVNVDVPGVLDMALSANNAYFATESGAFALPPAFLSAPDLATQRMNFSGPARILSLGFIPGGAAAPKLIMGTAEGLWEADVISESPSISLGSPLQITDIGANPITDAITTVEISPYAPDSHQAFLSRYWLYIRYYGNTYRLPFFAVIPGRATGMAWDALGILYISGTEGLSVINVGS